MVRFSRCCRPRNNRFPGHHYFIEAQGEVFALLRWTHLVAICCKYHDMASLETHLKLIVPFRASPHFFRTERL
ncbi:MAG: hypothetical protein U9R57_06770, partial [Thermodesulfobacteriota bacterium]|nr:hypothetical protein [Thermodesulfobacteriota bacterium]